MFNLKVTRFLKEVNSKACFLMQRTCLLMLSDEFNDYYSTKNMTNQKVTLAHITRCFLFFRAIFVPSPARLKVVFLVINYVF